ncbi:MAG: hypothetical protein AAF488_02810 [Planctomycetota bacterium]
MKRRIVLALLAIALAVAFGSALVETADEPSVPDSKAPQAEQAVGDVAQGSDVEPALGERSVSDSGEVTVSGLVTAAGGKAVEATVEVFEFPHGFWCRPQLVGEFRSDRRGRYSGRVEITSRDSLLQARAHAEGFISSPLATHPLDLLESTAPWSSLEAQPNSHAAPLDSETQAVVLAPIRLDPGYPVELHLAGDVPDRFQGQLKIGSIPYTSFVDWSHSKSLRALVGPTQSISPAIAGFYSNRVEAAEFLDLAHVNELDGHWTFELRRGRDIQGRFVDPDGLPLPGGRVFMYGRPAKTTGEHSCSWADEQWLVTDEEGRFTVRGAPHETALTFRFGHPTHLCGWRARGQLDDVELVAQPGRVLLVEFEVPVSAAGSSQALPVLFEAQLLNALVVLRREGQRYRSTPIDAAIGQWTVEFPGYRPVTLRWTPGVGELDLGKVPLDPGAATTVTVVSDGKPVPGAMVSSAVNLPGPFPRQELQSSRTNRSGAVRFDGLPQGTAEFLVRADGFTDQRVSFESAPRKIEISLSPLVRLRARLVTATGTDPIIAVFRLSEGREQSMEASPESAGVTSVTWMIDPGLERDLDLHVLDHLPISLSLPALSAGDEFDLGTVTLPEGGLLEVVVRDESGDFLEGAEVKLTFASVPFHFEVIPGGLKATNAVGRSFHRGLIGGMAELVVRHPRSYREDRRQLSLESSRLRVAEVTLPLGEEVRVLLEHADGSVPKYLEATLQEHGTDTTREVRVFNGVLGVQGVAPGPVTLTVGGRSLSVNSASDLPRTIVLDDTVEVTVTLEQEEMLIQSQAEYVLIGERGRDSGTGVVKRGRLVFGKVLPLRGTFRLWVPGYGESEREVDLTRGSAAWAVTLNRPEPWGARTVVVVGPDGAPIAGAALSWEQGVEARFSDEAGRIRIAAPTETPGWIHAPGWTSWEGTLRFDEGDTAVVALEEACELQCVVSGGAGVAPYRIEAWSHETGETHVQHAGDGGGFHQLPSGVYSVRLRDVSGLIDECVVSVTPGGTNRAELRTPPSFKVTGRATMQSGDLVSHIDLRFAEFGGEESRRIVVGSGGEFEFEILRPGPYSFECRGSAPIVRDLQPGRSIDLMFSTFRVRGVVVDAGGRVCPGSVFELQRRGKSYRAVTDPLGEFSLEQVPEGRYGVRFLVEAGAHETWVIGGECRISREDEQEVMCLVRPQVGRVQVRFPRDGAWRLGTWSDEGWYREIGRVHGQSGEVTLPTGLRMIYALSEARAAIATVEVGAELSVVEMWPRPFGRLTLRRPPDQVSFGGLELRVTALEAEFSMPSVKTEIGASATLLLLPGRYRVESFDEGEIVALEVTLVAGETTEAVLARRDRH